MRLRSLLSSAFALVAGAAGAQDVRPSGPFDLPLVIEHVTVVDVERGVLLADRSVEVTGTRITAIDSGRARRAAAARLVDGRGKFVIPGLWDMHVHLSAADAQRMRIPLLLANGVTGVRAMSQECLNECEGEPNGLDSARAWRRASILGERLFPRLVAGGPSIDGPRPARPRAWRAATAEDGANGVRLTRARGGAFVKVYSLLPRAAFFGAMREARRQGLRVAGHVPATVWPSEASDSGLSTLEHDMGLWEECSARAAALRPRLDSLAAVGGSAGFARISAFVTPAVMDSHDPARCARVFATLVRNGTWLVPTLVLRQGFAQQTDSAAAASDPRLRYVPAATREGWLPTMDFRARALGPAGVAARRERRRREPGLVGRAHAAGVGILAGTDLGNPYVFPGFALHDELALLVEGGLTPLAALQAATLNPARWLAATDTMGTVAVGKVADLVLLTADPLADIRNTTRIEAVMVNGRWLDRASLDALLAGVERSVAAAPPE